MTNDYLCCFHTLERGRRGRDRMVVSVQLSVKSVPFTNNVVSSNPVHGELNSLQHYVKHFVSDLQQVGGFLPGTPLSSTNKTDRRDITEILLKLALDTKNQIKPYTRKLLMMIQFEKLHKTIFVVKYEIGSIYDYPSTHIAMVVVSKLS